MCSWRWVSVWSLAKLTNYFYVAATLGIIIKKKPSWTDWIGLFLRKETPQQIKPVLAFQCTNNHWILLTNTVMQLLPERNCKILEIPELFIRTGLSAKKQAEVDVLVQAKWNNISSFPRSQTGDGLEAWGVKGHGEKRKRNLNIVF